MNYIQFNFANFNIYIYITIKTKKECEFKINMKKPKVIS